MIVLLGSVQCIEETRNQTRTLTSPTVNIHGVHQNTTKLLRDRRFVNLVVDSVLLCTIYSQTTVITTYGRLKYYHLTTLVDFTNSCPLINGFYLTYV